MQVTKVDTQYKANAHVIAELNVDSIDWLPRYRDSNQFATADRHILIAGWTSYMNDGHVATSLVYETSGEFGEKGALFIFTEGLTPLDTKQVANALNKANLL